LAFLTRLAEQCKNCTDCLHIFLLRDLRKTKASWDITQGYIRNLEDKNIRKLQKKYHKCTVLMKNLQKKQY